MKIVEKININDNTKKITKSDWIIIFILTLLYSILSFIKLGDTKVPLTYKEFNAESREIVVTLNSESNISKMRYYTGNTLGELKILFSLDGINYNDIASIKIDNVFAWEDIYLNGLAKYIKFISISETSSLGEVTFYDDYIKIPMIIDIDNPLTDELDLVPEEINYMNSTYFDEIYYARSAYEYVHKIACYEWTHPPLGKLLMAIPVALFGFSPFNYRLMGNIFGILLIPIMFILAKKIFKNTKWALLSALLMMFDNFHFVHSRIALIDVFQICFILLSVIFMKEYLDLEKNDSFKKKFKYLLLSGIFIGCAIATKWNAAYAGLGLAIIFFTHLLKQYNFNITSFYKKNITVNNILKYLVILIFIPYTIYYLLLMFISKNNVTMIMIIYYITIAIFLTILLFKFIYKDPYLFKLYIACCISFILTPIIIYISSYIIFPTVNSYDGSLKGIIDISKYMYNYHSTLDVPHPFSSFWYQWPIMYKPVWLYASQSLSGLKRTITDIGNPAIWWLGIPTFIYLVINSIRNKDKNNIFILIFILATFIPYIFISRAMFMYHYFITLPFVMLGITAFIKWITDKTKNNKVYYSYIIIVIITFIIFYPIVSGIPIKNEYIDALKWLSKWYF